MTIPTGADVSPSPLPVVTEPDIIAVKKAFLFDYLAALNIAVVHVDYNGSGDDGQIDTIRACCADNAEVSLHSGPSISHVIAGDTLHYKTIHDYLDAFAWDLIESHHEGLEIDDGGSGTLTFDVVARTLRLEKTNYFLTSETETVEV